MSINTNYETKIYAALDDVVSRCVAIGKASTKDESIHLARERLHEQGFSEFDISVMQTRPYEYEWKFHKAPSKPHCGRI